MFHNCYLLSLDIPKWYLFSQAEIWMIIITSQQSYVCFFLNIFAVCNLLLYLQGTNVLSCWLSFVLSWLPLCLTLVPNQNFPIWDNKVYLIFNDGSSSGTHCDIANKANDTMHYLRSWALHVSLFWHTNVLHTCQRLSRCSLGKLCVIRR